MEDPSALGQLLDALEAENALSQTSIDTLFRISQLSVRVTAELHERITLERCRGLSELQDKRDKLDAEIQEFRHFDSKLKSMQQSKPIKLNIGGTYFATTPQRLCEREPRSFFSVLFSGRWELSMEGDGALFIDRSPAVFHYILDYLRGNELDVSELTKSQLRLLQSDADFYQLDGLMDFFQTHPQTLEFGEYKGNVALRKQNTIATVTCTGMCLVLGSKPLHPPFALQSLEILSSGCVALGVAPASILHQWSIGGSTTMASLLKKNPYFLRIGSFPRTFDHNYYQWESEHIGVGSVVSFELHQPAGTISVQCDGQAVCKEEFSGNLSSTYPTETAYYVVVVMQANGCSVKIV